MKGLLSTGHTLHSDFLSSVSVVMVCSVFFMNFFKLKLNRPPARLLDIHNNEVYYDQGASAQ